MKWLLVTEKYNPSITQRDGGSRLVNALKRALMNDVSIMQFGTQNCSTATWCFDYPIHSNNRFKQRIDNAAFIAEKIKNVEKQFTHIAFIHVSMQFGFINMPLANSIETWTFPMLLTPSYRLSGEDVPIKYTEMEHLVLGNTHNILTPSYLEKEQLKIFYSIPEQKIHIVPRGVDTDLLIPKIRFYHQPPVFCNISSIKPQKNTIGLIKLFAKIHKIFPGAKLNIIGPIQNQPYYHEVKGLIEALGFNDIIKFTGYISPDNLATVIQDTHIHLFTSHCETFGRSIFETLASGIPNIAIAENNAAADFLSHLPYAKFLDNEEKALDTVKQVLDDLPRLSKMALEIGELYGSKMLDRLLVGKIQNKKVIAVSDFDGTLFHEKDPKKTEFCIKAFQKFSIRAICSARSLNDLIDQMQHNNLTANWIIAYSGAVVSDGEGNILFTTPMDVSNIAYIKHIVPEAKKTIISGNVVQMYMPANLLPPVFDLHVEIYKGIAFVSSWHASKFRAIHKLLNYIEWDGTITAFGDSKYDKEFITYFGGKFIQDIDRSI